MSKRINDISITNYTEKSFVIRGNTMPYKEVLKNFGGKWNDRLRDGEGWIFPITKKSELEQWQLTGISSSRIYSENSQSLDKFDIILKKIKILENKIEKLSNYIIKLNLHEEEEEEDEGVEESKGEDLYEETEEEKFPVRRLLK